MTPASRQTVRSSAAAVESGTICVRPLPADFRIALDGSTRRLDGGTVLVGGAPLRLLRLTPAGARLVDELVEGRPVGSSLAAQRLARRLLDGGLAHPRPRRSSRPYGPADVSVVIPIRGDVCDLERTLRSLGPRGEVVVVDDGSTDPAQLAAAIARHGARLLRHERPHGPAAARETGWRAAQRHVVAFVDAEVELDDGWLDPLLDHFADETVGAAAPRVVPSSPGGAPRWLVAYEEARSPLDLGGAEASVGPGRRVPYVPTAALVVRRSVLEEVGGFDEALRLGEDVDLVWRIVGAGWVVRYEPAVVARHPVRPTARAWLRQRYDYASSAGPLGARHGAAVAPLRVSGWSAAAWGLVLAGAPAAGAVLGAVTTAAMVPKLRSLQQPGREALRLAGLGNLVAGHHVAEALRRAWLPLALPLLLHRRPRPALVAVALVPAVVDLVERRPRLDPLRWTALRLIDDAAYCAGVWRGALAARTTTPLLPAFTGPVPRPSLRPGSTVSDGQRRGPQE